jgi:hypothetical protein
LGRWRFQGSPEKSLQDPISREKKLAVEHALVIPVTIGSINRIVVQANLGEKKKNLSPK